MSEKSFLAMTFSLVGGVILYFFFMLYGNFRICSIYYPEVGTLACMASSKTSLPSRSAK